MDKTKTKINLIRRVLEEIESEYQFTSILRKIPINADRCFSDFSPETILFDLIKHILDCEELPNNVCRIEIHANNSIDICEYSFVFVTSQNNLHNIEIVWEE